VCHISTSAATVRVCMIRIVAMSELVNLHCWYYSLLGRRSLHIAVAVARVTLARCCAAINSIAARKLITAVAALLRLLLSVSFSNSSYTAVPNSSSSTDCSSSSSSSSSCSSASCSRVTSMSIEHLQIAQSFIYQLLLVRTCWAEPAANRAARISCHSIDSM
jgi:hypothetical protein